MVNSQRTEKRYRAMVTLRHPVFDCYVLPGEDLNYDCKEANGARWRYPDDVQRELNNGTVELYLVPVGTPHVVFNTGKAERVDPETGEHSEYINYNSAAKQWAGESVFVDRYDPDAAVTVTRATDEFRIYDAPLEPTKPYDEVVKEWDRETFPDTRPDDDFYSDATKEYGAASIDRDTENDDKPDDYNTGKG